MYTTRSPGRHIRHRVRPLLATAALLLLGATAQAQNGAIAGTVSIPVVATNQAIHLNPPVRITILKRGVVQPAYGQPGGGVEVILVNGSPPNTVTGPKQIPP